METNSKVTHVADTALWVATYRALESQRPDALFHDPLADVLVGERGKKIAEALSFKEIIGWMMVVRTVAIDELIKRALGLGVDAVINLGAGLDTRPYRMALPASLRWIEIDFPHMIEYKGEKLEGQAPVCRLERIAADLSDLAVRRAIFQRIGAETKKVLVITEGVIPYLTQDDAAALSRDLVAVPSFQYWIMDYRQGGVKQGIPYKMRRDLRESPIKFDAIDSLGFFEQQGWKVFENRAAVDEAERIRRPFPLVFPWGYAMKAMNVLMPKRTLKYRKATGYVMYERAAIRS
jgi:methyltransferase (TIGR00027 family)